MHPAPVFASEHALAYEEQVRACITRYMRSRCVHISPDIRGAGACIYHHRRMLLMLRCDGIIIITILFYDHTLGINQFMVYLSVY